MKSLKASEVIARLESIKEKHGDVPVITEYNSVRDFMAIDHVEAVNIHPDDIANNEQGEVEYDGIDEECITCAVLS